MDDYPSAFLIVGQAVAAATLPGWPDQGEKFLVLREGDWNIRGLMRAVGMHSKMGQARWHAVMPWSICVALALITLGVFAQTLAFKFLNFDDNLFISENPRLTQGLSAKGLAWAFTANLTYDDANAEYWEPLTLVSRLADVQFSGLNAGAHHRTNVLLHLAAGLVLFGALRALLRSDLRSGLIALLFLVHPLHVEPVDTRASTPRSRSQLLGQHLSL